MYNRLYMEALAGTGKNGKKWYCQSRYHRHQLYMSMISILYSLVNGLIAKTVVHLFDSGEVKLRKQRRRLFDVNDIHLTYVPYSQHFPTHS